MGITNYEKQIARGIICMAVDRNKLLTVTEIVDRVVTCVGKIDSFHEYDLREFVAEEYQNQSSNKFNPFYDSDFLISHEGDKESRMLVELYEDELLQLRDEIDIVLEKGFGHKINSVDALISKVSGRSEQSRGPAADIGKDKDGFDMTD